MDCLKMLKISGQVIKFIKEYNEKLMSRTDIRRKKLNYGENTEVSSRDMCYHHYYLQ